MTADKDIMRRAIEIASERMHAGCGGPFGAVIARDGEIIAEGYNLVTSGNDPTAHAEIVAIREACRELETFDLSGHVIFTSCEPCPMCLSAIYWARLDRIYYANDRYDAAAIGFDDSLIYEEVAKPIAERTRPSTRLPLAEARRVFRDWRDKEDKIPY